MSRRVAYRSNTTRRGAHRCSDGSSVVGIRRTRQSLVLRADQYAGFPALSVTAFDLLEPTSLSITWISFVAGFVTVVVVVRTVARNRSVVGAPSPCCTRGLTCACSGLGLSPSARRLRLIRRPSGGSGRN